MSENRESDNIFQTHHGRTNTKSTRQQSRTGMGSSPSCKSQCHPTGSQSSLRTGGTEAGEMERAQATHKGDPMQGHPQRREDESAQAWEKLRRTQEEISQVQENLERAKEEISRMKEERNKYKQKYEELLSSLMSTKTEGTAKLYDGWRPDELAQKWDNFKSQAYFNAFFTLIEENVNKQLIGDILLHFCKAVYDYCVSGDCQFQQDLKKSLESFRRSKDQGNELEKRLGRALQAGQQSKLVTLDAKEMKKTVESVMEIYRRSGSFLDDLEVQALEEIHQQRKHAAIPETSKVPLEAIYKSVDPNYQKHFRVCEDYIKECYGLCRMMQLQIPTMHLDFDVKKGLRVSEDALEVHDAPASGVPADAVVRQLLVPALYRSKGTGLLVKGLVTIE